MRTIRSLTAVILLGTTVAWSPAAAHATPADDSTPPVVTSTGLTDGQDFGRWKRIEPVWSDDTAVVRAEILINGTLFRGYPVTASTTSFYLEMPTGLHGTDVDITVRAFDAAGNHGEATTRVRVDTVRPAVTMSPPLESFVTGVVTLTATEFPDDLARIVLVDHATNRTVAEATAAPWTMTWDTAGRNGAAWVHFEFYDKAGNVTLAEGFYAVDHTGPRIREVTFPRQPDQTIVDGRISGRSRLVATVLGNVPLDRVEWWVDGTLRSTFPVVSGGPAPYFDWDTGRENRTAQLEVVAYDILGQRATSMRRVVIDNTGPAITSITPGHRALVRGDAFQTFPTTVTASDPTGIRHATLHDGETVTKPPFRSHTSAARDGARTLTWTVTDRLGNTTTVSRVVVVDNTRPALKITKAPKNRAKVTRAVRITATAKDRNGVARVQLLVNGKVAATDTKAGYAFTVKPAKYGRNFTVQLRAYDKAGNVTVTAKRKYHR